MRSTKVSELMEENILSIDPDATLAEAARQMKDGDSGFLLVGLGARHEGVITDRDIVVRALAPGLDPSEERVRDCMTRDILSCAAGDSLATAAAIMREKGVGRLAVLDKDGYACGVLSFGHILRSHDDEEEVEEVVARATGRREDLAAGGAR